MHVCVVHYSEPIPQDEGFVITRYAALAQSLRRRGHQVTRIAPTFLHRTRSQRVMKLRTQHQDFGGFVLVPTPGYQKSRSFARLRFLKSFQAQALAEASRVDPTLLLIGMPQPGIAYRCREILGDSVKIVLDIRDLWPDAQVSTAKGFQGLAIRLISRSIRQRVKNDIHASDALISLSAPYLAWAEGMLPGNKEVRTGVFPLGTVSLASSQSAATRSGVIFIGSLSRAFDFESLLLGWTLLESKAPQIASSHPLVIGGRGDLGNLVRKQVSKLKHATYLGHVPHFRAIQMMTAARLAVAPYASGYPSNLPNKIFEYAGSGLPVVATLGGYAAEMIRQNGIGVSLGSPSPDWWYSQIRNLLEDDERWQHMNRNTESWAKDNLRTVISERMATFIEDCNHH